MNILVVGSGGREHAIAWKVSQSPRLSKLYVAPGNAGTALAGENVPIDADDIPRLVAFARQAQVDLVLVGPEAALAGGLVDALIQAGIRAFGPTQAAAEIESSKVFAKNFMRRHGIPTARFATFTDYDTAIEHLRQVDYPVVVKTSGLAAGKGVLLPATPEDARDAVRLIMVERAFGEAGDAVVIEERLEGEEITLLAFSDGATVRPLLPAQDHKRLLDQDQGPNTGGMGAYAPAPACPPVLVEHVRQTILQPTIDGLRDEGRPYRGVLYAGLILTEAGVQVLEYNCRFGDPETQALLPLLETDLIDLAEACAGGRLDLIEPAWMLGAAATVVLASGGYPGKYETGHPIHGLESAQGGAVIFHAGTGQSQGQVVTTGGRVLNVTGVGSSLEQALDRAYQAVKVIQFEGMQYRRDIGRRAARPARSAYAAVGVDISAGDRAVRLMQAAVRSTYTPAVLSEIGAFGGLYDAARLQAMRSPVLVASTDGVGTKVRLAAAAGRFEGIGHDIVNHCVNDILVQGARPLFFLDYFASSRLAPEMVARIVAGIAEACRAANCVLLGGETAEMPGVYGGGEFDLAGTVVGVVERDRLLPRSDEIQPGDLLVGLASNGPHTNGYSLIRSIFSAVPLETIFPELGVPLADALLAPHRSYLSVLAPALDLPDVALKALAHLTGGGFIENIPRILPEGVQARIHLGSWPTPPLFGKIQTAGVIAVEEMYRVFNMGIGMVAVVSPERLEAFQQAVPETTWVIGEVTRGAKGVTLC
jgi:phosphoribosylamine--glycine ligase/phosphoribosylformylglycinamidine cyclo-ligase